MAHVPFVTSLAPHAAPPIPVYVLPAERERSLMVPIAFYPLPTVVVEMGAPAAHSLEMFPLALCAYQDGF